MSVIRWIAVFAAVLSTACSSHQESVLTVAAAANLTEVFADIGAGFTQKTGTRVVFSYGATAQLAQQIENGGPYDVFAAADTEHVDALVREGKIEAQTRVVYARGVLALWNPNSDAGMETLARPEVRYVGIAKPGAAPYGRAAVEALRAAGLWDRVEGKVVYANNINMAKQFVKSGNADAAFTAYSLVVKEKGVRKVDPKLYRPLDQAIGVVVGARMAQEGRRFIGYILSAEGQETLRRFGFEDGRAGVGK